MKKLFQIHTTSANGNVAILLTRVAIALLMLSHGIPKMEALFSGNVQFPPVFGMSAELSLGLAVFAEVFCSLFILFGLGTRLAAIPLIVTMLVAVFYVHGTDPFAKKEPGLLYLLPYVVLFITGSGKYSLDYLVQRKSLRRAYAKL